MIKEELKPYYLEQATTIYCGHVIEVLRQLPDESIQMAITSPPYWGLRNYSGGSDIVWGGNESCEHRWEEERTPRPNASGGKPSEANPYAKKLSIKGVENYKEFADYHDRATYSNFCSLCGAWRGQLGLEPTPELYVEHLMMIFREVKRVLRRDGSFYLNIGDTYSASPTGSLGTTDKAWERPSRTQSTESRKKANRQFSVPPKCMVCIPEQVIFAMIEDGWILHNKIIWHKPNAMPSSVKDRFTTSWEYLYFFGKNSKTILWHNQQTGEWRNTRPTKEDNYPWGGRYQHIETNEFRWDKPPEVEKDNWIKYQPLWMGFDHYFDLDSVRVPHSTQSLERYMSAIKRGEGGQGKIEKRIGAIQHRMGMDGICAVPKDIVDIFGHGPNPQSFNLRVYDTKRDRDGATAQGGELKASEKEIEEYEYPEKMQRHHGSGPQYKLSGLGRGLTKHDQAVGRTGDVAYTDPLHTRDYSPKGKNPGDIIQSKQKWEDVDLGAPSFARKRHSGYFGEDGQPLVDFAKGKNPGDYWELTTQPYKGAHFAVFPERLCERPILASSRLGDIVLDPFSGSGTVGVAAKRLGRKSILIDCVEEYCRLSKDRIMKVEYQPGLEI